MSDAPSVDPSVVSTSDQVPPPRYNPIIDKSPPRPAPTLAYSWKECNPHAKVLYIRNHIEANLELSRLPHGPQAFGFDLEWKPNFVRGAGENPVALVQLANDEKIFLLQVSAMKEFPSKLDQILRDPLIVKGGVAIQSDAHKLYKDFQIQMYNCVDLSLLARTVDNARWQGKYNSSLGLARLTESYEYRLLGKGKVTRSNWEADLDPHQIEYASNDAHAGYTLYRRLESMQAALPLPPEIDWFSFSLVSGGRLVDTRGDPWHPANPTYDPGPPPPPRPPRDPPTGDDKGEDSPDTKQPWGHKRKTDQDHSNNVRPPQNFNNNFKKKAKSSEPRGFGSVSTHRGGRSWNYQQQQYGQQTAHSYGSYYGVQTSFQAIGTGSSSNAAPFSLHAATHPPVVNNGMGMSQGGSWNNNRYYNRGRDESATHNRHEYPAPYTPHFQSAPTAQGQGQGRGRAQRYNQTTNVIVLAQPTTVHAPLQDEPTTKLQ